MLAEKLLKEPFYFKCWCVCERFWLTCTLRSLIHSISAVCFFTGACLGFYFVWGKKKSALRCNYNGRPHEASMFACKHSTPTSLHKWPTSIDLKLSHWNKGYLQPMLEKPKRSYIEKYGKPNSKQLSVLPRLMFVFISSFSSFSLTYLWSCKGYWSNHYKMGHPFKKVNTTPSTVTISFYIKRQKFSMSICIM